MYNILAKILKLIIPFLIIWKAIQDNTNSESSIFIAVVINEMHVQEENYIQERERETEEIIYSWRWALLLPYSKLFLAFNRSKGDTLRCI